MRPPVSAVPAVGLMIPARIRKSVVLPEPFRPTRPTASPRRIWSDTSSSATTSVGFWRPRVSSISLSVRTGWG